MLTLFGEVPPEKGTQSDTWINIGAVIGMGSLLVTVMVFLSASTNARIDRPDTRIDRLDTRIDRLDARVDGLRTRVDVSIAGLRSDMRENNAAIHVRFDAIQEVLAEVGQRLAHVEERLGVPRAGEAEAAPQE